jgi:hypothetical protein
MATAGLKPRRIVIGAHVLGFAVALFGGFGGRRGVWCFDRGNGRRLQDSETEQAAGGNQRFAQEAAPGRHGKQAGSSHGVPRWGRTGWVVH